MKVFDKRVVIVWPSSFFLLFAINTRHVMYFPKISQAKTYGNTIRPYDSHHPKFVLHRFDIYNL